METERVPAFIIAVSKRTDDESEPQFARLPQMLGLKGSISAGRTISLEFSTDALLAEEVAAAQANASATPDSLSLFGMDTNIWARAQVSLLDGDDRRGINGQSVHAQGGLSLALTDRLLVGLFGSYFTGDGSNEILLTDIEQTQYGGGAYLRAHLFDTIYGNLLGTYETGTQTISVIASTGEADLEEWSVGGSIDGTIHADDGSVIAPYLSVMREVRERDAYTDGAGRIIPGGKGTNLWLGGGLTAAHTRQLFNSWISEITPRAGVDTRYYLSRQGYDLDLEGFSNDASTWSVSPRAGVTLATRNGQQLSIDAGVSHFGQDTIGYNGMVTLSSPL